jgi:hypothetical protein
MLKGAARRGVDFGWKIVREKEDVHNRINLKK